MFNNVFPKIVSFIR